MHGGRCRGIELAVGRVVIVVLTGSADFRFACIWTEPHPGAGLIHIFKHTGSDAGEEGCPVSRSFICHRTNDRPAENVGQQLAPKRTPGAPSRGTNLSWIRS